MKSFQLRFRNLKSKIRLVLLMAAMIFLLNACSLQTAFFKEEVEVETFTSVVHMPEFESKMIESVSKSVDFQNEFSKE